MPTESTGSPQEPQGSIVSNGMLHTTPSGHVQFLPGGMEFSSSNAAINQQTASLTVPTGPFPYTLCDASRMDDMLSSLPPHKYCTELKDTFFQSFASIFHILHDPTFAKQYAAFETAAESVPLSSLALLYAILSTGVIALDESSQILSDLSRLPSPSAKITDLASRYRTAAMRCLEADHYTWRHNITTLQALIILIYGTSHSYGPSFTLLGLAHSMAMAMGCHVDPDVFGLDPVAAEERRRVWAGLLMLYTTQNTSLGNIGPPYARMNATTRLPADVDDAAITAGWRGPPILTPGPSQMSYILFKFRLYEIGAELSEKVLLVHDPSATIIQHFEERLSVEQMSWERRYCLDMGLNPPHATAHFYILVGASRHLMLLLHRTMLNRESLSTSMHEWSVSQCLQSAVQLLDNYVTLNNSADLAPFRWYVRGLGSFHAFHAAIVVIALISSGECSTDSAELIRKVETGLAVMEQHSTLSSICSRAAIILRRLTAQPSTQEQSPYPAPMVQRTTGKPYTEPVALFDYFQTQQWLAPSTMPWNQWDAIITNDLLTVP